MANSIASLLFAGLGLALDTGAGLWVSASKTLERMHVYVAVSVASATVFLALWIAVGVPVFGVVCAVPGLLAVAAFLDVRRKFARVERETGNH